MYVVCMLYDVVCMLYDVVCKMDVASLCLGTGDFRSLNDDK